MKLLRDITCLILFALCCVPFLHTQGEKEESKKIVDITENSVIHYVTHLAAMKLIQHELSIAYSLSLNDLIEQCFSSIDNNSPIQNRNRLKIIGGITLGIYVFYKTPQWVDSYLLGINKKRSGRQNKISFMHRLLFGEVGALTGEYCAQQCESDISTT